MTAEHNRTPRNTSARTGQLSIRLHERDKERLAAAADACGMDASVVARQLVEMLLQRMEAGGDLIDALQEVRRIWVRPTEDGQLALLKRIERLEQEVQARGPAKRVGQG